MFTSSARHRKGLPAVALMVAAIAILAACGGGGGGQGSTINIGALVDLTGTNAETGQMQRLGAQMAVDEINASGGIKALDGAHLKLVVQDAGAQNSEAVNGMQALLASNNIVAGIGPGISSQALAISPLTQQRQTPFIDLSFDDKLTEQGIKYYFTTSPKQSTLSDVEFPGVAQLAKQAGVTLDRVAIIASTNVTNVTAANAVATKYAPRFGWNLVMNKSVQQGTISGGLLSALVGEIKSSNTQVLFIGSSVSDVVAINRQLLAEGVTPKPWVLNGAPFLSKGFLDALGPNGTQGIMSVASAGVYPSNKGIADKIAKAGQVPQEYNLHAYSTVYMIAAAMENQKSSDRKKVRDGIAGLNIKGGPAGSVWPCNCVRFDSTGRAASATALVVQWQNGKPETVLPSNVASAKPYWPRG